MIRLVLTALDGSNPLAFLASIGTLRLAHLGAPTSNPRLSWTRIEGVWRPQIETAASDEKEFCAQLEKGPWAPIDEFSLLGSNLTVPPETFLLFVKRSYELLQDAHSNNSRTADFAVAFGCEACSSSKTKRIEYTDLCFITGSGHQDFLGTAAELARSTTTEHLRDALFGSWRRERGLSMRWDPADISEYALQWANPSTEGASAVRGACRLAFEALPCFPTMPVGGKLATTGFHKRNGNTEFTWPIWHDSLNLDCVRSLLAWQGLQDDDLPDRRQHALGMGIGQIFRADRVRIGQGANFKVSFRPARSV
jgi:hypothetical protein